MLPPDATTILAVLQCDGIIDHFASAVRLGGAAFAQLSATCHAMRSVVDRPALWAALARLQWGPTRANDSPSKHYFAQRTVCERWNLKLLSTPARRSAQSSSSLCGTPSSSRTPLAAQTVSVTPAGKENATPRTRVVAKQRVGRVQPSPAVGAAKRCISTRLRQDLFQLMLGDTEQVTAFPESPDDMTVWRARVTCSHDNSALAGSVFALQLVFDEASGDLPLVRVVQPACQHPNVDGFGVLCARALQRRCSPVDPLRKMLEEIRGLLQTPCFAVAPLNEDAAARWF